ncbi:hypothetical protein TNCT_103401 [Trichonephila clavata]|uniref:Uncharacterized protein n=1 Tax=Trichonephila clavata TaxID=2740835 RepID=A0A8X6HGE7_TRICU|nr:hypothetical protein TNCT_103401 [Trichonephila clavata]
MYSLLRVQHPIIITQLLLLQWPTMYPRIQLVSQQRPADFRPDVCAPTFHPSQIIPENNNSTIAKIRSSHHPSEHQFKEKVNQNSQNSMNTLSPSLQKIGWVRDEQNIQ